MSYRYTVQLSPAPISSPRLARRLFAWRYSRVRQPAEYARRRRQLLAGVTGDLLEIGPGPGTNLKYLSEHARWTGLEPNVFMHERIRREAASLGREVTIVTGAAGSIPMPDASVDAVVGTLVLCSIDQPGSMLSEVLRVLRPGGAYLFLEHVAAPRGTLTRRLQDLLTPVSRRVSGGCEPNRESWAAIETAGFREIAGERFELALPLGLRSPHVVGRAVK